jgi:4-hydroxybenzoate polyprenyltransferase
MAAPGGPPRFWSALADLIRLRNQTGSLLLLFPTLWALVLAGEGHPPPFLTAIFIAGVFVMRSAGVAINDWWDRDLDRLVERTRERPLAAGRLHPRAAVGAFIVLIGIAAALVSLLNPLTIALAPMALLLALLYPLAKRVMPLPQAVLGMAFGWGAVMAWAAVRNEIGWPALGLFAATICWAVGYDTIYALQDIDDDRRIGVRSSAIFFGKQCGIAVGSALLAMAVILALVGAATGLAPSFYLSLVVAAGLFVAQAQQVRRGVSQAHALALFKQHVGIGALILVGIWSGIWFR